ncbi:MAG: helix-turn-helix transcriptional regulator [Candidatus Dormibacteria bacterium]
MGRLKTPPEVDKKSQAVVRLLKARREHLEWSQPELARRLGISVETIRAIEQGKHPNLAFFTVARWARVVGASLEELEALSAAESESGGQE